jgi:hypothetical protein
MDLRNGLATLGGQDPPVTPAYIVCVYRVRLKWAQVGRRWEVGSSLALPSGHSVCLPFDAIIDVKRFLSHASGTERAMLDFAKDAFGHRLF